MINLFKLFRTVLVAGGLAAIAAYIAARRQADLAVSSYASIRFASSMASSTLVISPSNCLS